MSVESSRTSGSWTTVRVFISSTFRDMHAERDQLVKVVFPALRERLEAHHVHLVDIDLRWGVTRQQADNDRVLGLCLSEIDQCRPFFVGLLGERYGWIPGRLPADLLERFPWISEHPDKSLTEMEILHGVLRNPRMRNRALFFLRDPAALAGIPQAIRREVYLETDAQSARKLAELKVAIRSSGHFVMDGYSAQWNEKAYDRPTRSRGRLVQLEGFGNQVLEQLWSSIQAELALPDRPESDADLDPLAVEQGWHERFLESRQRVYVGRDSLHEQLLSYLGGQDSRPLMLTGRSGSGKSAVLARLVREIRRGQPETLVVPHFVGASPDSSNLRQSLRRFCATLQVASGRRGALPDDFQELVGTFRSHLSAIPPKQRLIVLIDAIDQWDVAGQPQELSWLPERLQANVKMVLSCCDDPARPARALERARKLKFAELSTGALSDEERRAIIQTVPSLSARTLDDEQIDLLLTNPATCNPLFLQVALEELRGFGSFEYLKQRIAEFPRPDGPSIREQELIQALFRQMIARLEEEFDPETVRTVLALLGSSRRGLSEKELQALVAPLAARDQLFPILRQIRGYLMQRGAILDFQHRELKEAVAATYLADPQMREAWHRKLAEYFLQDQSGPRRLEELPWQLVQARDWKRLFLQLSDLGFFSSLYAVSHYEALEYWHHLEATDEYAIGDAYREVLRAPADHDADQLVMLASLLEDTGHFDEALDLNQFLLGQYKTLRLGEISAFVRVLRNQADILFKRGRWDDALLLYQREEELYRRLQDDESLGATLGNQGRILLAKGELDEALDLFRKQERISRKRKNTAALQVCLGNQALVLYRRGNLGHALNLFKEQERLCRETGDLHGLQLCLGNKAVVLIECRDSQNALDLLREKESICRRLGDQIELSAALGNQGHVFLALDDPHQALECSREQERICREIGNRPGLADSLGNQGVIQITLGNFEEALTLIRKQGQISLELGDQSGLANALLNQALLMANHFDAAGEALPLAEEAVRLYEKTNPGRLEHAQQILVQVRKRASETAN